MRKIVQILDTLQKDLPNFHIKSHQIDNFTDYFSLLDRWNKKMNLTAIRDRDAMIVKHLLDSLVVYYLIEQQNSNLNISCPTIDFGSGAGIPGLILAIANPSMKLVSVDKSKKKIAFQQEVVRRLKLFNVKTLSERLENLANQTEFKNTFDLIITRAFDQIKDILGLADLFLSEKGKLILWKGIKWKQELDEVEESIKLKFDLVDVYDYQFPQYQLGGSLLLLQKIS